MKLEDIDGKVSGVYRITCNKNNKNYIGVSKDIRKRWTEHIGQLRRKIHHSTKLQKDYNKYGEDAFEFRIIVKTDYGEAKKLEDEYIKKYKSDINGYNCENIVKNNQHRDEMQCEQILKYIKDSYASDGNIYCYDLFNMAKCLNIPPTDFLKFIGINSSGKFNVYRYLDSRTIIGLNWSNENIFVTITDANSYDSDIGFVEVDVTVF